MKNSKDKISFFILTLGIFLCAVYYLFNFQKEFATSNFFLAIVTLVVGGFAIYLYLMQKIDSKKSAAKIIVQEIRRAEDIMTRYKEQKNFSFTKKIIANNSWGSNVHFFIGDLSQDEIDRISTLYSTGEFLDYTIKRVFDLRFDKDAENFPGPPLHQIQIPINKIQQANGINQSRTFPNADDFTKNQPPVQLLRPTEPFWNSLFDEIIGKYEPIYNSPIIDKLKRIAKIK